MIFFFTPNIFYIHQLVQSAQLQLLIQIFIAAQTKDFYAPNFWSIMPNYIKNPVRNNSTNPVTKNAPTWKPYQEYTAPGVTNNVTNGVTRYLTNNMPMWKQHQQPIMSYYGRSNGKEVTETVTNNYEKNGPMRSTTLTPNSPNSSVEECWASNLKVPGSNPCTAKITPTDNFDVEDNEKWSGINVGTLISELETDINQCSMPSTKTSPSMTSEKSYTPLDTPSPSLATPSPSLATPSPSMASETNSEKDHGQEDLIIDMENDSNNDSTPFTTPSNTQLLTSFYKTNAYETSDCKIDQSLKDLTCHLCNKVFKKNGFLKRHMRTMHFNGKLTCKYCPRQFSTSNNLEVHTNVSI